MKMLVSLWTDVRHAWRGLRRAPGFATVAVGSLAFGLTLTATTLAVVNAYLLRSMPIARADRLYHVVYSEPGEPEPEGMARIDWRVLADVVEQPDPSTRVRYLVGEGMDRQELFGLVVAPTGMDLLGVRTVVGRSLLDGDFQEGAEPVLLIGHALWTSGFGADPGVVGRTLRVQTTAADMPASTSRIVGVLEPGFRYARDYAFGEVEFVSPLTTDRTSYMVLLRAGASPADVARRITEAALSVAGQVPPNWPGVRLESIHDRYVADLKPTLVAISTSVAIVILVVCLNLMVIMLLRALRREKEVALRVALGAESGDIARMLAAEAASICALATGVALSLTGLLLRALAPVVEARLGRGAPGGTSAIALDATVVLLVSLAGFLVAAALSSVPLLTPWQRRLTEVLRRVGREGTGSPLMRRVRSSLIVLEVAASLALLVGGGLMVRTVVSLVRVDLGYQVDEIVRGRIALPADRYRNAEDFLSFYDRLSAQLEGQGVAFALTDFIPFFEYTSRPIGTETAATAASATVNGVSDRYLELLGIPVLLGRGFTSADRLGGEPVVLVSESLARRLRPDGNVLGDRITVSSLDNREDPVLRAVVGVVADVRQTARDLDPNDVYVPFAQAPPRFAPILLRTDETAARWSEMLRAAVAGIDGEVLVTANVTGSASLASEAERQLAAPRFLMWLLATFATSAGLLAVLGVYGVTAYAVQQRRREAAIRIAVGATERRVIGQFVREGGTLIGVGLVLGLVGGFAVARLLTGQIHGLTPFDVPTFLAAFAVMAAGGLLATLLPARRAGIRNPTTYLNES
jgi:predicted permease